MSENPMPNLDLNIIPLHRKAAENQDRLPGFHTAIPTRKTSRSRRSDQLILLVSFNVPAFSDDRLTELLTRLESMYYEKTGSTTSAMRELIEDLNNLILNLNLRHAGNRPQVTGSIGVIVIRSGHLFLAQSGPGHLFALIPGKVEYLHDEKISNRGLGISRTPQIYYTQLQIEPGNKILFSINLPETWDANTFTQAYVNPIQKAHLRFLEDAGDELKAIMIEAAAGQGKLNLLKLSAVKEKPRAAQPQTAQETTQTEKQAPQATPAPRPQPSRPEPDQTTPPAKPPVRASLPPQTLDAHPVPESTEPVISPTPTSLPEIEEWEAQASTPDTESRRSGAGCLRARTAAARSSLTFSQRCPLQPARRRNRPLPGPCTAPGPRRDRPGSTRDPRGPGPWHWRQQGTQRRWTSRRRGGRRIGPSPRSGAGPKTRSTISPGWTGSLAREKTSITEPSPSVCSG